MGLTDNDIKRVKEAFNKSKEEFQDLNDLKKILEIEFKQFRKDLNNDLRGLLSDIKNELAGQNHELRTMNANLSNMSKMGNPTTLYEMEVGMLANAIQNWDRDRKKPRLFFTGPNPTYLE